MGRDHPVILYNEATPADRARLTLAHELGHLVLHVNATSGEDVEAEAKAFAAEFLIPAEVVRPSLRNLKVGRLLDLKVEYGVSMQALIERAYHPSLLSPTQRTNLYKTLSAKGWRTANREAMASHRNGLLSRTRSAKGSAPED